MGKDTNIALNIVSEEQRKIQNHVDSTEYIQSANAESNLARYIYYFLIDKIDTLPDYDDIKKFIAKIPFDHDVISMGYGIIVLRDLTVECLSPVSESDNTERVDVIKKDSYEAFLSKCVTSKDSLVMDRTYTSIDISKYPLFDEKKIKILQQYIAKYNHELYIKCMENIKR